MKEKKLISIKEAAKISPYEQGYLSLLARRGELKAEKVGRNWFTTVRWLNEYIEEKKPDQVIEREETFWEKISFRKEAVRLVFWIFCLLLLSSYWFWEERQTKLKEIAKKQSQESFVSEEIIKIPNEDGGYDVYETAKRKVGQE